MNCERFLDRIDALDGAELPADMAAHASSCPGCAAEAAALKAALSLYRLPDAMTSVDLVPRVMALLPFLPRPRRSVSMRDWLIVGGVIMFSMMLLPFLAEFKALKLAYGVGFTLPLALVLGFAITLYAGLFAMSHLDGFAKRLKEHQALVHAA